MKILRFISDNIFFLFTLFFLAFIPLYPKRPLLDIQHTWVYIRVEDFFVAFAVFLWVFLLLRKKTTLRTPLTLPILLFWIGGAISTLHGVLLIFPSLQDVFSNVAFLSMLRRIEYIFLFFIAFTAMKDKKFIYYVVVVLVVVLLLVIGYGMGQKFYGFPAFLTMNEEFAKGVPIQLSQLSRVPSTFAGHYDLAAYLVLIIPILCSMVFGVRRLFFKIFLLGTSALGFVLLFMTVSRVSVFVLLLSMVMLLILQKKRSLIIALFLIAFVFLGFSPSLLQRFGSTVSEVDVLVDAKTGNAIGSVKEVPSSYFKDKHIMLEQATNEQDPKLASISGLVPFSLIPSNAALVTEPNNPTGENLPQGTSYINLPLSPVTKKVGQYFYQKSANQRTTESVQIFMYPGDYIIKRAKAYDLSFTTRFQGEWPRTMEAFKRNIFLGNGYGSVSLAVDNNYLRILGESGLVGFGFFLSIFLTAGIYIKKILPNVESQVVRSFVLGFVAGTFGLALNAVLIDVFEASKIAFTYWLLMGVTLGTLQLYKTKEINLYKELLKVITSSYAVVIYLLIITAAIFYSLSNYYFVGDDFTWLRWTIDCQQCEPTLTRVIRSFTDADGFFYRPGTKLYFSFMHASFWLNQTMYHLVSLTLHFFVATLVFVISKRILKSALLSAIGTVFFLTLSGHHEAIFWISSTGFLFNAAFALLSLLLFIYWKEKKKIVYFIASLIAIIFSLLFHELGVVVPLLIIAYDIVFEEKSISINLFKKAHYVALLSPILPYLVVRFLAQSHWFSGDYSYNLLKLPYNIVGNTIGYLLLVFLGPSSLPFYTALRNFTREQTIIAILASIAAFFFTIFVYRLLIKKMQIPDRKIVIFASLFFVIALLPFLGLGNITSRYSYLSSFGFILLFVLLLKKTYSYLLSNGRNIAIGSIVVITLIFFMVHLFQLQKIHTDWNAAGEKSKRFLISLNENYSDGWTKEKIGLYFVDVPIRYGDAWVFPVGLEDAVWFVFRNQNIRVYQMQSVEQAFSAIGRPENEKVFVFDENGKVFEMIKTQSGTIVPVKN